MGTTSFPRFGSRWIAQILAEGSDRGPKPPSDIVAEGNVPPQVYAAYRISKAVPLPLPKVRPSWNLWAMLKAWRRQRFRKMLSRLIAPQRKFNAATIVALATHIRTSETRLLDAEAKLSALGKDVDRLNALLRAQITAQKPSN
jgi:hypothetical protein